jgi:hypothetical protein
VKGWDPDTPYLTELKKHKTIDEAYNAYLAVRKDYVYSPAFYFDVATFFFNKETATESKKTDKLLPGHRYGVRILCTVVELELESPQLLRIVGYKLAEMKLNDLAVSVFEKVLSIKKEEPQSFRDLAIVLMEDERDFEKALQCFNAVVTKEWDNRFDEIELTALIEMNRMLHTKWGKSQYEAYKAAAKDSGAPLIPDPRLVKHMPVDLRLVLSWDTDMTDVDLHVLEPRGEDCHYGNKSTRIGGQLSRDFTGGYGPEEYSIKKACPGKYAVQAKYFASHQQSLPGGTTLLVSMYRYYGTDKEQKSMVTMRLQSNKDIVDVCTVDFK